MDAIGLITTINITWLPSSFSTDNLQQFGVNNSSDIAITSFSECNEIVSSEGIVNVKLASVDKTNMSNATVVSSPSVDSAYRESTTMFKISVDVDT